MRPPTINCLKGTMLLSLVLLPFCIAQAGDLSQHEYRCGGNYCKSEAFHLENVLGEYCLALSGIYENKTATTVSTLKVIAINKLGQSIGMGTIQIEPLEPDDFEPFELIISTSNSRWFSEKKDENYVDHCIVKGIP